ncbi:class I SAM-dependent methyltransferase [Sinomicrobium sp. M5D2P17]
MWITENPENLYHVKDRVLHTGENIAVLELKEHILKALCIEPNSRVLDVLFGSDPLVAEVTGEAWKTHYFGLETSEAFVRKATKLFSAYTEERKAIFNLYDGEKIPYVTRFFHRILSTLSGMAYISPAFFTENHRVLAENGIMVIVYKPWKQFDEAVSIIDSAMEAGFIVRDFRMLHVNRGMKTDTTTGRRNKQVLIVLEKPGRHLRGR